MDIEKCKQYMCNYQKSKQKMASIHLCPLSLYVCLFRDILTLK